MIAWRKKWMRRALALAVAGALTTSLAGCGEEGDAQAQRAERKTAPADDRAQTQADAAPEQASSSAKAQTRPPVEAPKADAAPEPVQTAAEEQEPLSMVEKGGKVYAQCAICHGPYGHSGIGKPLAGQSKDELVEKLKLYRSGKKIGVDASIMTLKARHLSDADIEAVATYIAERLKER